MTSSLLGPRYGLGLWSNGGICGRRRCSDTNAGCAVKRRTRRSTLCECTDCLVLAALDVLLYRALPSRDIIDDAMVNKRVFHTIRPMLNAIRLK